MSERSIILRDWEVRAFLDRRKTQVRRVVKPQPPADWQAPEEGIEWREGGKFCGRQRVMRMSANGEPYVDVEVVDFSVQTCPFGSPGDVLWAKETWRFEGTDMNRHGRTHSLQDGVVSYADGRRLTFERPWQDVERWMTRANRTRSGISMPRWASRLSLRVLDVRVQRLQEISEEEARAEGVVPLQMDHGSFLPCFEGLWDSHNKRHPWSSNPWVWAATVEPIGSASAAKE